MFDNLGVSLPLVQAGNLKLLAVASAQRLPSLPDVPTHGRDAAGLRGGRLVRHRGAAGHAESITEKINADVNEALAPARHPGQV